MTTSSSTWWHLARGSGARRGVGGAVDPRPGAQLLGAPRPGGDAGLPRPPRLPLPPGDRRRRVGGLDARPRGPRAAGTSSSTTPGYWSPATASPPSPATPCSPPPSRSTPASSAPSATAGARRLGHRPRRFRSDHDPLAHLAGLLMGGRPASPPTTHEVVDDAAEGRTPTPAPLAWPAIRRGHVRSSWPRAGTCLRPRPSRGRRMTVPCPRTCPRPRPAGWPSAWSSVDVPADTKSPPWTSSGRPAGVTVRPGGSRPQRSRSSR
jgi:hypothetical protein